MDFPKSTYKKESVRVRCLGQNLQALASIRRQIWTFKIKMPALNVPISTNKVSIFKLTME